MLGAPVAVVALIEGLADGVAAITKIASRRLADWWRRRPLVAGGYGAAAAGKVLIALATTWPIVLAARAVDRLGNGIRGAPRDALIADDVPSEHLGGFGFHRSMDTLGAVIGPLAVLGLFELFHHRYRPVFLVAVVSAVAVVFVRERPRPVLVRSAPEPNPGSVPAVRLHTSTGSRSRS